MAAILYLLGCTLIPGQTMMRPPQAPGATPGRVLVPSSGDWLLVPRLRRGQELVFRGTYSEEGQGESVQFSQSYRLESRILVLDTPPTGAEVAVLTLLKHRPSSTGRPAETPEAPNQSSGRGEAGLVSVRLERAHVSLQGKITADAKVNLLVPLYGAPTLECAAFVALPSGRISLGQEWTALEGDRPPLTWQATGTEMVAGYQCIKLVGEQKSEDWDHPRGDRSAWLRRETVWLSPQLGLATRLEREILQREPAHREATQRNLLRLDMESSFQLSGQAGDSRRQEVMQVFSYRDNLKPLLTQPTRYGPHLAALQRRIDQYLENQPETPYRPALLQVKRSIESAQRGETPPEPVSEIRPVRTGGAIGQRAPDFMATSLTGADSAQLRHWLGKPVVLVFYHPSSTTAATVLRFAQQLQARFPQRIHVAGMSISDNTDLIRRQQADLGLTIPLLSAGGVRGSFGVASTPKIVILDAGNVIRGEYLGWAWGGETAREVEEELRRWLPASTPVQAVPQQQR